MTRTKSKGFTLIELLVVIAIIGVLSTLAVVALNSARQKARDAKRVADVKQIQTALELYYNDNNSYPLQTGITLGLDAHRVLCGAAANGFVATGVCAADSTTYMGAVPSNPSPNGIPYVYEANDTGSTYTLDFNLETTVGNVPSGNRQATPDGIN